LRIKIVKDEDAKISEALKGKQYIMRKMGGDYDITILDETLDEIKKAALISDIQKAIPANFKVKEIK